MRNIFVILVIVSLVHVAIVCMYFMWNGRWSQTMTYCSLKQISYSMTDTSNHPALSCGVPCYHHDNRTEFHVFLKILDTYKTLHKTQRHRITNGQPVNSLTWYCITGCGGIGDRIKGMYAAFLLALTMNRTFFIYQSEEIQKTMYIEPNAIDWRPVNGCIKLNPEDRTLENFGRISEWQRTVFGEVDYFSAIIDKMKSRNSISISGIRTMAQLIRSINQSSLPHENKPLVRALLSLLEWGPSLHCLLSILHQYLFQVPQQVVREATSALAMLNLHPQKFVSVHIRTGFMNRYTGEILIGWDFIKGVRFARRKESWKGMIECALQIADSDLGKDSLVFVSSDDQEPKDWALTTYGERIRVMDIHPVHVSRGILRGYESNDHSFLQNWVEMAVVAQSYAVVRIPSGFSDTAAHMCSISPLTIYTYSVAEKWCRLRVEVF